MKIKITSHNGHEEAVLDSTLSERIFNKLTGKTTEPIEPAILPESLRELKALFSRSKEGYFAATKTGEEMKVVHYFDPNAEEMVFFAPIVGG